jgi:hypothetical protein
MLQSAPPTAAPSNRVQAFMQRNVSPKVATNTWFMAAVGAVVALVSGLLLTAIAEALWSAALDQALATYAASAADQIGSGLVKSLLTPDLLKFYLFEQHVPFTIHADLSSGIGGGGGDLGIGLPITGLIVIPGIALILGGYLSSASDYTHNIRSSLLRGALIGPFYGVLLAILALISSSSAQISLLGASAGFSLSASPISAFLYGVLWGALFGTLGGWIQFAGRRCVSGMLPTMQATRSRWLGAGVGGVVAVAVGVLLTCALTVSLYPLELTALGGSVASSSTTSGLSASNALLTLLLIIALLPAVAAAIFTVIAGAPYEVSTATAGLAAASSGSQSPGSSVGLFNAQTHPAFGLIYLVVLIPIVAYLIGGRISARIAGATRTDTALVAGALIGVPSGLLMAVIAYLLSITLDISALGLVSANESVAPSVVGAFLVGLIGGAIFGALGGVSEIALPRLGSLGHVLVIPLRPLALAIDPLLDRITRHPRQQPRSAARRWLYDAAALAVALVLLVIIVNIVNTLPVSTLPFHVALIVDVALAALVIALPLLYLTGALVVSLSAPMDKTPLVSHPIEAAAPMQPVASAPLPGFMPGSYAGYPSAPAPGYPGYPSVPMAGQPMYPGSPGSPGYSGYSAYPGVASMPMPLPPLAPTPPPVAPEQSPEPASHPNDETVAE